MNAPDENWPPRQGAAFSRQAKRLGGVYREARAQGFDLLPNPTNDRLIFHVVKNVTHPTGQVAAFGFAKTAGGDRRRANTQAGGHEG